MLDLIDAMQTVDRDAANVVLDRLRTSNASRLIPTVTSEGSACTPAPIPRPGAAVNAAG